MNRRHAHNPVREAEFALLRACKRGRTQEVIDLLSDGVDPNVPHVRSEFAAASAGQVDDVHCAFSSAIRTDKLDYPKSEEDIDLMLEALERHNANASVNAPLVTLGKDAVQHERSARGTTRRIELLIRCGAAPNRLNANGFSPMEFLLSFNRATPVDALLDAGLDPATPVAGQAGSIAAEAACRGRWKILERFLQRGLSPNHVNPFTGQPLLFHAASSVMKAHFQTVDLLLAYKIDLEQKAEAPAPHSWFDSVEGQNVLEYCAHRGLWSMFDKIEKALATSREREMLMVEPDPLMESFVVNSEEGPSL